jgi:hypothetical protein
MTVIIDGTNGLTFPDSSTQSKTGANATNITSGVLLQSYGGSNVSSIPVFSAYSTAYTSLPNGAWTKISFDTKEFDTANCYSTSTNIFTPTVAGYYQINASCSVNAPGNQFNTGIAIYKNNSSFKQGNFVSNNTNGARESVVAAIIYFNGSTDYVDIRVYQDQGSTQQTYFGQNNSYFQGCLIRGA